MKNKIKSSSNTLIQIIKGTKLWCPG